MPRTLWLAAYDIRDSNRLKRFCTLIKSFSHDGQKSVYECLLNSEEKQHLLHMVHSTLHEEDSFLLVRVRSNPTAYRLGHVHGKVCTLPLQPKRFLYLG